MATSPKVRAPGRGSPADEAWKLILGVMGTHRRRVMTLCQEFELSPQQLMALRLLDPDEPSPMSALAERLACDNSNVTGIVDRLEKRSLVRRRSAEHDRRVKMLELTDGGLALRTQLVARFHEAPPQLAALSAADQRALRDLLRRALG